MPAAMTGVPDFEVRVDERDDRVVVAVSGELDLATVDEPRRVVLDHLGRGAVVLDLSRVSFMDSSAVQLLDELLRAGGRLTFRVPASEAGSQVLAMTGMLDRLPREPE